MKGRKKSDIKVTNLVSHLSHSVPIYSCILCIPGPLPVPVLTAVLPGDLPFCAEQPQVDWGEGV